MSRIFKFLVHPTQGKPKDLLNGLIKNNDDADRILQPVIDKKIHIRLVSSAEILPLEILPVSNEKI